MTRAGGPRPEVRALLEPALPYLGAARRACSAAPAALVLVGPGRDPTVCDAYGIPFELVTAGGDQVHVAAAPLERVTALAREYAPSLVRFLEEPLEAGAWCLVLATAGVAVHVIHWPDETAAASRATLN